MTDAAELHVNKLAAAQRQLDAAIRMYFGEEDDLAIHTVVSAAYSIISDLKSKRGRDESVDILMRGIFYACRNFTVGEVSEVELRKKGLWEHIQPFLALFDENSNLTWDEFVFQNSEAGQRSYWRYRNRFANFLKHADKDSQSTLPIHEMDNLSLINSCAMAYIDLCHNMTKAMVAHYLYLVSKGIINEEKLSDDDKSAVLEMKNSTESERRLIALTFARA
jgi:hypothetical protein